MATISPELWRVLGVLAAIALILLIAALIDWFKQPKDLPNRTVWLFIIIFVNTIGPIFYFLIGPRESNRALLDEPWELET